MLDISTHDTQSELVILNNLLGSFTEQQAYIYSKRKTETSVQWGRPFSFSPSTTYVSSQDIKEDIFKELLELVGIITEKIYDTFMQLGSARTYIPKPVNQEGELSMTEEIKFLVDKLKDEEQTKEILTFVVNGIAGVWVVIEEADINLEVNYSNYLFMTLEKYPEFACDFMVFGKDEIKNAPIPEKAITVFKREGAS